MMIIQLLLKLGHFVCKIGVVPILFVGFCTYDFLDLEIELW